MSDLTTVQTEPLRILFDALCNSLDFGSGFLDTEEVNALRYLADVLGVDPMTATPSAFVTQYAHQFVPRNAPAGPGSVWQPDGRTLRPETPEEFAARVALIVAKCEHCSRLATEAPHPQAEVSA